MFDKSKVKYVVESNGEDYSLMYRIICNDVSIQEELMGESFFASEDQTNLVSLRYTEINGEWYCFYEPTAVKVDWNDVEIGIKKLFPDTEKIKPTSIVDKFVTIED
ncbi:hypothetical protein [Vibrio phage vB_VibM_10AMN]|uniref:Uncharacterized protein n=1 Tax=Staphylococcus phage vB_VibM_10AMN12 TaxID=3076785 RepID=A0AA96R2D4_9CAUD|nr:hypothetical protein [Vibrio phage vB_VibM_10AMN]WNO47424.1 hypothetical protein [Staphylococcus phage vB_VibM_10AMN12]